MAYFCHSEFLSFRILIILNFCYSKLLSFQTTVILNISPFTQASIPKGQENWLPEVAIFVSCEKIQFVKNGLHVKVEKRY